MNQIYFGHGRYGIEEAARGDFGKSAKDLTIAEAALLAGRIAQPRDCCSPRRDMKCALTRRAYVLDQMHEKGFLPDARGRAAKEEPREPRRRRSRPQSELAPEAIEIARKMLREAGARRRRARWVHDHDDDRSAPPGGGAEGASRRSPGVRQAPRPRRSAQGAPAPQTAARKKGRAPPPRRRTRRSKGPRRSSRTRSTSASSPARTTRRGRSTCASGP